MSNSLIGRRVSLVRLHVVTMVEGLGNLGPGAITENVKQIGSSTMTVADLGILFKHKDIEVLLPWTNVISAQLKPTKAEVVGKIELPKTSAG